MTYVYSRVVGLLLVAVTALQLTGCDVFGPDDWFQHRWTLQRNRNRWEDLSVRSYHFTYSASCECIPSFIGPVEVAVDNGVIVA